MSVIQELESRVVKNMGAREPAGMDWSVLVEKLLPILTDLLSGCLIRKTKDQLSDQLEEGSGNFWNRYAMRRALRQVAKEENLDLEPVHGECCQMILAQLGTVKPSELVDEIKDNVSDWDLV